MRADQLDTVLTYAKLDLWAKFQDFQVRIRDAIVKRQATGPHHDRL
ncbi:P2 family phage major capsid protein [Escherichia coli]|nr:P2 family phage major capsid protein [Escherichia coli]